MDWHTSQEGPSRATEARWRKEEEELRRWEEPGAFGLSVPSIRELTSAEPESWERKLDWLEGFTDETTLNDGGVIYP